MKSLNIIETSLRYVSALILLQTLWFKFNAAPESVWIFTQLHVEPWGRYASGTIEAIAAALLLSERTKLFGALIALPAMFAALLAHVFVLGIAVYDDGGLLFVLAIVVFNTALFILMRQKQELRGWLQKILRLWQAR